MYLETFTNAKGMGDYLQKMLRKKSKNCLHRQKLRLVQLPASNTPDELGVEINKQASVETPMLQTERATGSLDGNWHLAHNFEQ